MRPEPAVAESRFELVTWDWKESPDMMEIGRAIARLSGGRAFITEVDTGSDQVAIFVSTVPMTIGAATEMYRRNWYDENWSDA